MNRGEMNYFIDVFLRILLDTLQTMYAELKEKRALIALAEKKLSLDTRIKGKNQAEIMYILSQNAFFHHTKGLTVQELAIVLKLSEGTVRRIVKELIDCELIQQQGIRPAFYYIDDAYLEEG